MTTVTQPPSTWWGSFALNYEQSKQWNIGPLILVVRSMSTEWQIAHERIDDSDNNNTVWSINDTDVLPESLTENSRYVFHDSKEALLVMPLLPDRPVISRPATPFNLTAGEEVTLFVSLPLWMELAVDTSPKKILKTIAIQRPSDTWFGPSTLEGELCYASTSHCRLSLEEIPQRPHRVITPVLIRNMADTSLALERLYIPAPLLSLYASSNGQLWTPQVSLVRNKDGEMAELEINNVPPKEAQAVSLVSEPRKTQASGTLIRAFNAVFN